jgi:diaminopimelate epimerase
MSSALLFSKYEGLGNDFLLVEGTDDRDFPPGRVSSLCDRHFGVGADGVLLVLPSRTPDCAVRMRVLNADGSVPEMCGNGIRCVALHVARGRRLREARIVIDTDSGPRACMVDDGGGQGMVTVDMGVVRVLGERTLFLTGVSGVSVAGEAGGAGGKRVALTTADAGNPHAVLFGAFSRQDVEQIGPRLATHPDFPGGTNVEFALVAGDGIDLVVWERGVGITLACGTAACAVAAVACDKGLAPRGRPLVVRLPGGALEVTIAEDGRATMRGPARLVFSGSVG